MRTIHLENAIQSQEVIEARKEIRNENKKQAYVIMSFLALIALCMIVNPIIVFALALLISLFYFISETIQQVKSIEYDLGNDVLDNKSLDKFLFDPERIQ